MAIRGSWFGTSFESKESMSRREVFLDDRKVIALSTIEYLPIWSRTRFSLLRVTGLLPSRVNMSKNFGKPPSKGIGDLFVTPGRFNQIPALLLLGPNQTAVVLQGQKECCFLSVASRQPLIQQIAFTLWYIQIYIVNKKWRTYIEPARQYGNRTDPEWWSRGTSIVWTLKSIR